MRHTLVDLFHLVDNQSSIVLATIKKLTRGMLSQSTGPASLLGGGINEVAKTAQSMMTYQFRNNPKRAKEITNIFADDAHFFIFKTRRTTGPNRSADVLESTCVGRIHFQLGSDGSI